MALWVPASKPDNPGSVLRIHMVEGEIESQKLTSDLLTHIPSMHDPPPGTHTYAHMHTCTAHTGTHMHTCTHALHTHTYARMYTHKHAHIHKCTHI